MNISKHLAKNKQLILNCFGAENIITARDFKIANTNACIIFLPSSTDNVAISDNVLNPSAQIKSLPKQNKITFLKTKVFCIAEINDIKTIENAVTALTKSHSVVLIDGEQTALELTTDKVTERAVAEPPTSAVLYGPRKGFVESIKTNISSLRQIISSPNLKFENIFVGKQTSTQITVSYLNNIADNELVKKIKNKISSINIDGIIDSNYIAEFLELHPGSIFKQIGISEKPDIISAKLLEGRVAILVDGSPIVLTLPYILLEDLQSSGDYYSSSVVGSLLRIIRVISILLSTCLPGLYIAIELYHYKAVPINFLATIINTTKGLPLTPFAEILFVLLLFEILYEASLRMPRYLGLAISIVGGLILGDTAVKGGLISPPAVMIVAFSGLTMYTTPELTSQIRVIRFILTLAGGTLGFYGMVIATLFIIIRLSSFDSYGAPYLAPFAPTVKNDIKDSIFVTPRPSLTTRPQSFKNKNKTRLKR